jgi:hypothetical protein
MRWGLRWIGRVVRRIVVWTVLLGLMLTLLQYSDYPRGIPWYAVAEVVANEQFDYVTWELQALGSKLDQTLYGIHPFLDEAAGVAQVRVYMQDLQRAQALDGEINAVLADPTVPDAEAASANLRTERDALRRDLRTRQPLIEAILEGQVAQVLVEQGFGVAGQVLPPVSAHFTRVPNLLIVSPRDQIRFDISINVNPMSPDAMAALETRIDAQLEVASLIVPLGGIALYPAMVLETASIPYALDTIAHEWLHHYLFFYPLGLAYFSSDAFAGETRIINETTAALFGIEMSRLVLARFYPDLMGEALPDVAWDSLPAVNQLPLQAARMHFPGAQTGFDFSREMDVTRRQVDALLAARNVAEAEAYMEARRALFVANGYLIRKLNQAYFAFYGGYQAGGNAGAAGADPIGPTVQALRELSPSLQEWVVTMRGITTREGLLAVYESVRE